MEFNWSNGFKMYEKKIIISKHIFENWNLFDKSTNRLIEEMLIWTKLFVQLQQESVIVVFFLIYFGPYVQNFIWNSRFVYGYFNWLLRIKTYKSKLFLLSFQMKLLYDCMLQKSNTNTSRMEKKCELFDALCWLTCLDVCT